MTNFSYTAEPYERLKEYPTIPDGTYKAKIIGAEKRTSQDHSWESINFKFEIDSGEFSGRLVFHNAFVKYTNLYKTQDEIQKILNINKNKLNGILESIKLTKINNLDELLDRKLQIKIKTKPDKKELGKTRTDVVDYFDYFYVPEKKNQVQSNLKYSHGEYSPEKEEQINSDVLF